MKMTKKANYQTLIKIIEKLSVEMIEGQKNSTESHFSVKLKN